MSDQQPQSFSANESARLNAFSDVWSNNLNDSFADIAKYYDRGNYVATLGLYGWLSRSFIAEIDVAPNNKLLDVCAGTMAVSIALLKKEPSRQVNAIDRSEAMLNVGSERATNLGLTIDHKVQDVHKLPYPDNSFDMVTLQYASRHLKVVEVFKEIHRVLKPGGRFYHCDMLRPENKVIEFFYHLYLRFCLSFTALLFRSAPEANNLKKYFVDALMMFYSSAELTVLLEDLGFTDVKCKTLLAKTIGMHSAQKP
jgi:demethylmenaquinone methyltransferase/2-methoxy-6-polyprenyl-1,4-benzoquinol methylase